MNYEEEQANEVEALESIYSGYATPTNRYLLFRDPDRVHARRIEDDKPK